MTKKKQYSMEDDEELVKDLVKKRGVVKGKLTFFSKFVESLEVTTVTDLQKAELQVRIQKVELLFQQFSDIQDDIDLKVSEFMLEKEMQDREAFENLYYAVVAKSKLILDNKSEKQSSTSKSCIKLPTISLPSFDGTYDNWLEFRDTFLSLIHSAHDIDNVQKFHYLRSALTGNALQVIKSLEFSADNYVIAWDLLQNRYNNNRLLVHNHVKALFSMQSINKESSTLIRKLMDTVLRNIRALKTLGEPTDTWDTLIIYIIVSKLDSSTEREWELYKGTILKSECQSDNKLTLSDLIKFLRDRADVLETIKVSHVKFTPENNIKKQPLNQPYNSHSYVTIQEEQNKQSSYSSHSKRFRACTMCRGNHGLYSCSAFLKLSWQDKIKFLDDKKLCRNCLRAGHAVSDCWFGPCKHCSKKHNSLIHIDSRDDAGASTSSAVAHSTRTLSPQGGSSADTRRTTTLHTTAHTEHTLQCEYMNDNTEHSSLSTVLLSSALVEIADKNNKYHTVRALLDNGSQHCFISQSLCNKLHIPLIQSTFKVTGIGNSITQSSQSCEVQLRSKTSNYNTRFNCLVLPNITTQLPSVNINTNNIRIPDNITLADCNFHTPTQIDLLIGADKFWELLNDGLIRLNNGPYLQNTKLGWIISGTLHNKNCSIKPVLCNHSQTLDTKLKQLNLGVRRNSFNS